VTDADAEPFPPGRSEPGRAAPPRGSSGLPVVPGAEPEGGGPAVDLPFAQRWRPWLTPERWAVIVVLAPAVSAVAVLGRLHPDEVYQFLEPAYLRVHGYGVLAWEWQQGLRNWAAPLALAAVLRVGVWLGLTDPWVVRGLVAIPLGALQAVGLVSAVRLGRQRGGHLGGWTALAGLGLLPVFVVVAGRTLGEALSAALLLIAAEALSRDERARAGGLLGGAALGLAFVARYGSVPALAAALAWVAVRRRWALLGWTSVGLGAVLLGLGALDWASWGAPWHSVLAWFRFNVGSSGAARIFGAEPPGYYWPLLWRQVPLWTWPGLLLGLFWLRPRLGVAGAMAGLMMAALLATSHKEERFLYPVVVLLVAEAAPGLGMLLEQLKNRWQRGAVAALGLVSTALAAPPTMDLRGDQFRAIVKAARPAEVTGLLIVNEGLWGSGGFFYVGKRIPWLTCDWPRDMAFQAAMRDRRFNRAVTFEGRALAELEANGFRRMGQEGRETILVR
jgi:GPI mannosyltransferase 3